MYEYEEKTELFFDLVFFHMFRYVSHSSQVNDFHNIYRLTHKSQVAFSEKKW